MDGVFYANGTKTLCKIPSGKTGDLVLPATVQWVNFSVTYSSLNSLTFTGPAPDIFDRAFAGSTLTCYYPANDPTWTADKLQDYGGDLNWLAAYSGNYGDGIWWELSGDQLVIYSMTGEQQTMEQQSSAAGYPWYAHRDRISTVFASNVDIGDYAFDGYTNLKTFETHTGTTVGTCAFRGCSALADITFGGEVPVIAADAFTGVTAQVRRS